MPAAMRPSTSPLKDLSSSHTAMSYDAFKPKFPLDPFSESGALPSLREPWTVETENLPLLPLLQAERRVILVIGQPSTLVLEPLFHSLQLTSSLLVIASHRPPSIPTTTQPSVRLLRLRAPIAVEDAGASRLVDIMEWAEQISRVWRRSGGARIQELIEEVSEATASNKSQRASSRIRFSVGPTSGGSPTSLNSSESNLFPSSAPPTSGRSSNRNALLPSSASVSSTRTVTRNKTLRRQSILPAPPPPDPEQRPFDVIFNFLPADIADKALLKHAILVTTLARPYLVAANVRAPGTRFWSEGARMPLVTSVSTPANGRRWSLFRGISSAANSSTSVNDQGQRSTSNVSVISDTAGLAQCRKSRIVHLLPSAPAKASQPFPYPAHAQAQARLTRSIEAFLLSFSFPFVAPTAYPKDPESVRARPYLLPASALSDVLSFAPTSPTGSDDGASQSEWTLAELILSGALDVPNAGDSTPMSDVAFGKQKASGFSTAPWVAHRAWIGGVGDVVVRSRTAVQTQRHSRVEVRTVSPPLPPKAPLISQKRLPTPPDEGDIYLAVPSHRRDAQQLQLEYSEGDSGLPTPPDSEKGSLESDTAPAETEYCVDVARPRVESDPFPAGATRGAVDTGKAESARPVAPAVLRKPSSRGDQTRLPKMQLGNGGSTSNPMLVSDQTVHRKRSKWKFWKD